MKTKNTLMVAATLFAAVGLQAAYLTAPITIDTRFVGDAGNAADTGGTIGTGAVAYDYYIGTTEVTAGQYAAFLNAVASKSDINGLYNADMYDSTNGCGIQRTGNATDGYTYTVTKGDNMPVNYVSVYDAMRFCNWLTSGNTEIGVYTFTGANDISLVIRNNAAWQAGGIAIASLDEWYKAAFYQGNGTYSMYANGTNTPNPVDANYVDTGIGTITDVDFGALSYYGTYGQNGNVWEWTDTVVSGSATNVYLRGGQFANPTTHLAASYNNHYTAVYEYDSAGFRVSSLEPIPEPSTYAAIFGALALAVAVYRRRK
jgi:PEP-CTERM putative exosortase interaction domain